MSPRKRSRAMSVGLPSESPLRVGSSAGSPPPLRLGHAEGQAEGQAEGPCQGCGYGYGAGCGAGEGMAASASPSEHLLQRDETAVNELLNLAAAVSANAAEHGHHRPGDGRDCMGDSEGDGSGRDGERGYGTGGGSSGGGSPSSSGSTLFHARRGASQAAPLRKVPSPTVPMRSPPSGATKTPRRSVGSSSPCDNNSWPS
jgi:hypothetical protein